MFKAGVSASGRRRRGANAVDGGLTFRPWIGLGVVAYLAEIIAWVAALSSLPLSHAFPILTLSYAGVAIGSWFLFDEKLRARAVFGIALLTAGAVLAAM